MVLGTIYLEPLVDFNLQNINSRLLDCQVCHLDVKAVEVDAVYAFANVIGEVLLAGDLQAL